jgi:hypothetical protein
VAVNNLALTPDEGKVIKLKRELVVGHPSTPTSGATSPLDGGQLALNKPVR